jgi:hypothetical protein
MKTRYDRRIKAQIFQSGQIVIVKILKIVNWFDLFKRTCDKYHIVNEEMYNMNEKGYIMNVRSKIRLVLPHKLT